MRSSFRAFVVALALVCAAQVALGQKGDDEDPGYRPAPSANVEGDVQALPIDALELKPPPRRQPGPQHANRPAQASHHSLWQLEPAHRCWLPCLEQSPMELQMPATALVWTPRHRSETQHRAEQPISTASVMLGCAGHRAEREPPAACRRSRHRGRARSNRYS